MWYYQKTFECWLAIKDLFRIRKRIFIIIAKLNVFRQSRVTNINQTHIRQNTNLDIHHILIFTPIVASHASAQWHPFSFIKYDIIRTFAYMFHLPEMFYTYSLFSSQIKNYFSYGFPDYMYLKQVKSLGYNFTLWSTFFSTHQVSITCSMPTFHVYNMFV